MTQKINQLKLNTDNDDTVKYYVAFSYLDIRPLFKAKLFEYFDYDIKRAFGATKQEIEQLCLYYEISFPKNFIQKRDKINIDECFEKAFLKKDVKILTYQDEKYPELLKEIPDFPLSLYYLGKWEDIFLKHPLAIVGSRKASQNAKSALNSIISELNNSDLTIISGLAYGIDAQAHQSALNNNIKTIAVIGSGLDFTYPVQNKKLYQDIIENNGVIFSEYPLGIQPEARNFPQRNRIVVGMAKGTLVAEAQIKSGAMISANLTLDYNRELMCMPGNILNPNTSGIYSLIKNGAGIVTCAKDLLNQMDWDIILKEDNKEALNEIQTKIMELLMLDAKSFDEIAYNLNEEIGLIMVSLTELELKGLIKQQDNKYYINK